MKNGLVKVKQLQLEVSAGANLYDVTAQAIALSMLNDVQAMFIHNGREYLVDPGNIVEYVHAQKERKKGGE
jgi:hypothetical protein